MTSSEIDSTCTALPHKVHTAYLACIIYLPYLLKVRWEIVGKKVGLEGMNGLVGQVGLKGVRMDMNRMRIK